MKLGFEATWSKTIYKVTWVIYKIATHTYNMTAGSVQKANIIRNKETLS